MMKITEKALVLALIWSTMLTFAAELSKLVMITVFRAEILNEY
jgi:hypothetical protein